MDIWAHGARLFRTANFTAQMTAALGMTEREMDLLFIACMRKEY